MSLNKVLLMGRLGADPELRYTQGQTAVCNLRLATNDRRRNPNGEWVETTEWHRVVTFGKTAENCGQYLKKGREIFVEGRIRTNKWQDQEGKDRYTTEILAQSVQFIGGGRQESGLAVERVGGGSSYGASGGGGGRSEEMPPMGEPVSFDDDDIPF
ncbi:MAG: single-stranded DNA-binding protein [Bdellovibrionales bacterium]|nr:single-stranded DNA-binding protein [Bdellovibrionales bacterium]